ncbi:helix-turn-helix domain-containing protein [Curtobacterium flaccumfaciens pv. betae]|uniref:helix-turn-helix domain-containing protein n=1 Tax=Curtobacterium flaccumfaciens TaxID=2035 RepID=UPI001BDE74A8|nr:helix-turn-helix domain-containing protein [Curtobacterium flaccumfaciens]MBT1608488.1 helix-turn-helix domain-containing protein [Curtobacterium flaccumfaciens pv. betae]MBT1657378.1 helix-turn-helix domain-containing protein [Curtobacterium flaccumfaciens pv. betae]MCS5465610.1 helix-turn-helix domain-containing protein [Curtobacterium flaccumfaciens pv. betae]MCX2873671.1 helix-turn-helix domain-containing protein [Curtobacterium flaccumfaciens pv. betae]
MTMGIAAAERCDDFGWHPRGRIDTSLVAEIEQHPRFGMGHAWSRSAAYNLTTAPTRTYLVLTMEGGFEFDVDGSPVLTEPGSLILLDGEAPTIARTLTETARFVWHLEPTMLNANRSRFRYGEPIPTGGAAIQALTSMTNALLSSPTPTSDTIRHHLALSFENLLIASLDEAGQYRHDGTHRDGLFMAALAEIEAHFRDPGFTVPRLAKEVSCSVRTLHETFRSMGSTPRREIERRRTTEANKLADALPLSLGELAVRSGFTSARQLARALNRTDPSPAQPNEPFGNRI